MSDKLYIAELIYTPQQVEQHKYIIATDNSNIQHLVDEYSSKIQKSIRSKIFIWYLDSETRYSESQYYHLIFDSNYRLCDIISKDIDHINANKYWDIPNIQIIKCEVNCLPLENSEYRICANLECHLIYLFDVRTSLRAILANIPRNIIQNDEDSYLCSNCSRSYSR